MRCLENKTALTSSISFQPYRMFGQKQQIVAIYPLSRRPSFEHAGLTSITFSLFHSELKTYLFKQSYTLP